MNILTPKTLTGIVLIASMTITSPTFAQTYGGNTTVHNCLSVDQMVSNPSITKTIEYIDNISPSDIKYQPNSTVIARLKIKNTSSQLLSAVKITNTIPQYVAYFAGPGTLSPDGKILTIDAGDLQAGEEKFFYVTYKTARSEDMPADKSIICVSNLMSAQGSSCNRDDDTAQMCIEKSTMTKGGVNPVYQQQLQAVKTAPKAGPEYGLLLVGANALLASIGYTLKKRQLN